MVSRDLNMALPPKLPFPVIQSNRNLGTALKGLCRWN